MDKKSRFWFLTYPQINVEIEDFHEAFWHNKHLGECCAFVIAREEHTNGGIHYHCLVAYSSAKRIRSPSAFDLRINGSNHHGNWQVVRDLRKTYEYVTKDGVYIEDIEAIRSNIMLSEAGLWTKCTEVSTKEEALELIKRNDPKTYLLNRFQLDYGLERHFNKPVILAGPKYERHTFTSVPEALDRWAWDNIGTERPKSLFIIGPTRTGKTSWARSLGKHIYNMSALVPTLVKQKSDEEFILFDDIEQTTLDKSQLASSWRSYVGSQQFITVHDKYQRPVTINWGIPSVWCLNKMLCFSDMDYVHANSVIVYINKELY